MSCDVSRESVSSTVDDSEGVVKFLKRLFAEFSNQSIGYAILRNYESLPEPDGGDVDILIDDKSWRQAIEIARQIGKSLSLVLVVSRYFSNGWKLVVFDLAKKSRLELHLQSWVSLELSWVSQRVRGISTKVFFEDIETKAHSANGFDFRVPNPADEALFLYRQWLFRGKDKYKNRIMHLLESESLECATLIEAGLRPDTFDADKTTEAERHKMLQRLFLARCSRKTLWRYWRATRSFVAGRGRRFGLLIYLAGPDGAGKTSVADYLSSQLKSMSVRHHRIYSMKKNLIRSVLVRTGIGRNRGKSRYLPLVEDVEDRDTGKRGWRIRKMFNLSVSIVDVFACTIVVQLLRLLGRSVIVETSPYEIFIKYHMPKTRMLERCVVPFMAKPTKGLLLVANARSIVKRKDELRQEEIEDYYARMRRTLEFSKCTNRFKEIRTDCSIDETNAALNKEIANDLAW